MARDAAGVVAVDDELDRPERLVEWAQERRDQFERSPADTYPGVLLDFLRANGLVRAHRTNTRRHRSS